MASQSLLSGGCGRNWRRPLLTIATLLIVGSTVLWAHEDPLGDIHPEVMVKDGRFVVESRNSTKSSDTELHTLKQTFEKSGKLLEERRQVVPTPAQRPYAEYSFIERLPEDQNGLERKWGEGVLIIPEYQRKHGGMPFLIEYRNDTFSHHRLSWKVPNVYLVVDAYVSGDALYLLVTKDAPVDEVKLSLHKFSLKTFAEESSVDLPKAFKIYSSPVCSNIIEHEGVVYVGLVEERLLGFRLLLVGWDGKSSSVSRRNLTTKIDWNTSLSLAHVGNNALIAYHYPGSMSWWAVSMPDAKILTIPFKLK